MEASETGQIQILELLVEIDGRQELRLVAIVNGALAGMASVARLDKPAATVFQVFVDDAVRRCGVGTALVAEAERLARAADAQAISALVQDGPAGFWGALGYKLAHCEAGVDIWSKQLGEAGERACASELQQESE